MIERTVVQGVSMLRVSFNQVFKLTFNFTDMSVFSYKKTKVNHPTNLLRNYFKFILLFSY